MKPDVKLMKTYNLMDYSLLMCIQENPDYSTVIKEFRSSKRLIDATRLTTNSDLRKLSVGSNSPQMNSLKQRFSA